MCSVLGAPFFPGPAHRCLVLSLVRTHACLLLVDSSYALISQSAYQCLLAQPQPEAGTSTQTTTVGMSNPCLG